MKKTETGLQGIQGIRGSRIGMGVLKTIGILLAVKVAEAFFSTGHAVLKQATKSMEKKLQ